MTALILDTGALVAVKRDNRSVLARLRVAHEAGIGLRTCGVVLAEALRDERGRQAVLAGLLAALEVRPVDEWLGRAAGVLLARTGLVDPVDACVVATAEDGDRILTTDPGDLRALASAARRRVPVIPC